MHEFLSAFFFFSFVLSLRKMTYRLLMNYEIWVFLSKDGVARLIPQDVRFSKEDSWLIVFFLKRDLSYIGGRSTCCFVQMASLFEHRGFSKRLV